MSFSPATRLGPYEILAPLGAGGMGEVYKARDTRLNRNVAVKTLPESLAADKGRLRRFTLEAQSASSLNHPNILAIYDIGTHEGTPYLVSELLEGETLRERMKDGKLSVGKSVDYARQISNGLAAAHAKDITHRDIKPENIFITRDGRAKILDFGLAKMKADVPEEDGSTRTATVTAAGTVMGTVGYMAPEQVRGLVADARADIFSFGVVLYEMLAGRRAFQRDTAAETMTAILKEDPPDLLTLDNSLPPALDRLVRHCLENSPEERFQSARDIAFDLESIAQPSDKPPAGRKTDSRQNRIAWAVAAVMALGLASVSYLYFRPLPAKSFHRLTFRRGKIHATRFTPDGNGVVYSAQWEDEPSELFSARLDSPGARALGFPGVELRAISVSGELALAQNVRVIGSGFAPVGMLARVPLSGTALRPVEDNISFADWSSDGKELAVVRESDQVYQLEYPLGKILYRTSGYISQPRISPDTKHVAFLDHALAGDNRGSVAMVDRAGIKKTLTGAYQAAEGLAWSAQGDEVWFSAARTGARFDLRAVKLGGRERVVYSAPASIVLQDIFRDGRVLVTTVEQRCKMMFRGAADLHDRDLSWLDWSLVSSLSRDGKLLTFFESGEGAGDTTLSYLRDTNGSAAVSLGAGSYPFLSPDGQSVVTFDPSTSVVVIYPVGPGQPRRIPLTGFTLSSAGLLADGKGLWFNGSEPSHGSRYYLTGLEPSRPRAITPEGVRFSSPGLVLDGKYLAGPEGPVSRGWR
ncbi:MAG TPA: protein kinase [Candidatus Acidoferrales bacterium]|nr:protein kinase [Candidatus Acidoferrales bacterium]